MDNETAPKAQLLITEHNVTQIVNGIFIKKRDILDPRIIDYLRHLVEIAKRKPNCAEITHQIFQARMAILEYASEIYLEQGEEKLFDESTLELEVIKEILEEHTIIK